MEGTPKHSIDAFVGTSDEEVLERADDIYADLYENPGSISNVEQSETIKERLDIQDKIFDLLPQFLKKYGLGERPLPEDIPGFKHYDKSNLQFSSKHVEHAKKEDLSNETLAHITLPEGSSVAGYSNDLQRVTVFEEDRFKDNLLYAEALAHEFIHAYCFQSKVVFADKEKNQVKIISRRSGFNMRSVDKKLKDRLFDEENMDKTEDEIAPAFFDEVNEAIVEELAIRFIRENLANIPHINSDIVKRDKDMVAAFEYLLETEKDIRVVDDLTGRVYGSGQNEIRVSLDNQAYIEERHNLEDLVNDLYDKNKEKFSSPEEIFVMMAKVAMTGRVLDFARLYESTYGEKSFRELGRGINNFRKSSEIEDSAIN